MHTHTSSERDRGVTTIESKNTAVHVPCSSVCVYEMCVRVREGKRDRARERERKGLQLCNI